MNTKSELYGEYRLLPYNPNFNVRFIEIDGRENSIIDINGKQYRERVELLLFKDDKLYLGKRSDGGICLPGGSTESDESWESQVIKECQEEAFITPKDVKYIASYRRNLGPNKPKYMDKANINYSGTITHVFIGKFDRMYNGYVDPRDKSRSVANGKFIPFDKAINMMPNIYKEIFSMIKTNSQLNAMETAHVLGIATEGIIFGKKPNVRNIDKWDSNPKNCVLLAFTKTNSNMLDKMCKSHSRPVINIHINEIDPWSDELHEIIMGVRQSQYRDIYNALAGIPIVQKFLTASNKNKDELNPEEVKALDKEINAHILTESEERAKLIKDVILILTPFGSRYRFVLKGLDDKDMKLIKGFEALPYLTKKN